MVSNTTTTTDVNLSDWSFRNWPTVVFYVIKNILFFVSAAVGVIVILLGVAALIAFVFGAIRGIVLKYRASQQKTGPAPPPPGSQDSAEEHLLQERERDIGDEEAAEQLVISENEANIVERDGEEAPPTYDAVPQDRVVDVIHKV